MNPTRPRVAPALFAVVLVAAGLGPAVVAKAQGFGPDPFRPYNSQYDAYVFGVAPGALDGVGNPTLNRQGVRNANQFREAVEGLDNSNRYDRSFRAYDQDRRRVYQPNAQADEKYNARRDKASDIYFQYLRETDPRKRAALFKEYNQAQSAVARGLADDPNARGSRRARAGSEVPATPADRPAAERPEAGAVPPSPDGYGSRSAASARGRRRGARPAATAPPAARSDIPPAPTGDDPSPSDVLDRASRSGRGASAAPNLP